MPARGQSKRRRRNKIAQAAPRRAPAIDRAPRLTLMLGGVLLLTMLVYLRCLSNGFVFDDHEMIVLNRYLGQWSFLWKSLVNDSWWFRDPLHLPQSSYYRPLQDIWLGIHYQLFGLVPAGWHATMVVLHLTAVWLVFAIASRLTGDWRTAMLAAAIFGLIPVHAEAVVWPTAIPLPLSAVFELAAFYLFIARRDAASSFGCRAGALIFYAGALFTHESAVAFPALVAAYVFLIEAPQPASEAAHDTSAARARRALVAAAPFAAETLVYLIVRYLVLGFISRRNPVSHATNAQVLMTIPPALALYLSLLAMPWFAGPSHRLVMVTSPSSAEFWLGVLVPIVAGGFFLLVRSDRRRQLYLFCAAWIAIAIAPMMNLGGLFHQGLIQDRYLYMASVGWCLMAADVATRCADRSASARHVVMGVTGALVVTYAVALWHVQSFWHDEVALFTRCIEEFPESAIWHNRLGMALQERGQLIPAERELSASLRLDPGDGATLFDLGLLHARLGQVSEGASEVAMGLRLVPNAPASAYVTLAQLYELAGNAAQSEATLKYAGSLPAGAEAVGLGRANAKIERGDNAGAEEILHGLALRFPGDQSVWATLGAALFAQNRDGEALEAFGRALKLAPDDPQVHLYAARALLRMGRDDEALEHCRLALRADPGDPAARALMSQITRAAAAK